MKNLVRQFAESYTSSMEHQAVMGDEQRTAYNPVIFVFIGDKVSEGVSVMKNHIEKKWGNSEGVLYFHLCKEKRDEGKNIISFPIRYDASDPKKLRKSIYESFYNDEAVLIQLNEEIIKLRNKILAYGSLYKYNEKINISLISRVDDPLNVLIPEITLLLKTKMEEHFKIVYTDLYALISEKEQSESFGYSSAVSASFFRELEYIQDAEYSFRGAIEVLREGIKLEVVNHKKPIYDLVYLLSDKKESGLMLTDADIQNYEAISFISLLKNRSVNINSYHIENQYYDNHQFKSGITYKLEKQPYVTAGLAKVKRPNYTIAVTVFSSFFDKVICGLQQSKEKDIRTIRKILELDESSMKARIDNFLPKKEMIDEMMGLMPLSAEYSLSQLEKLTLEEAEKELYGESSQLFFKHNFEEPAIERIKESNTAQELKVIIWERIVEDSQYGMYCALQWCSGEKVLQDMRINVQQLENEMLKAEKALQDILEERIAIPGLVKLPFQKKKGILEYKKLLIHKIYDKKLELLCFQLELQLLKECETVIEVLHQEIKEQITKLENMQQTLRTICRESIEKEDEYLGQNIKEYYEHVVNRIFDELSYQQGEQFYLTDKYLGSITRLLRQGEAAMVERLIDVCKKHVINTVYFKESFEEELQHRANVSHVYGKEQILTKEELFESLFDRLEERAKPCIYLNNYTVKHRYEEKYFFGDYESEFLQYVFHKDAASRDYKLGCIHEKRTSGIEKLNLMGGFFIGDIRYAINALRYYTSYKEQGYLFHGIEDDKLPNYEPI